MKTLGKIEGAMPQINMLIKKGEKAQARTMEEEALKIDHTYTLTGQEVK